MPLQWDWLLVSHVELEKLLQLGGHQLLPQRQDPCTLPAFHQAMSVLRAAPTLVVSDYQTQQWLTLRLRNHRVLRTQGRGEAKCKLSMCMGLHTLPQTHTRQMG